MLATLSISVWGGEAKDRRLSDESAFLNRADRGRLRTHKALVRKELLQPVKQAARKAREAFWRYTAPGERAGERILPAGAILDLTDEIQQIETHEFWPAVDEFVRSYDPEAERHVLGNAWNAADYPSHAAIRSRFGLGLSVSPYPDPDALRVSLGSEWEARVRREAELRAQHQLERITRDAAQRIYQQLTRWAERITPVDGKRRKLHDTLFTALEDVLHVLPHLNVAADPRLDRAHDDVQALLDRARSMGGVERLRNDLDASKEIGAQAQILADSLAREIPAAASDSPEPAPEETAPEETYADAQRAREDLERMTADLGVFM